jgi:hypothetical protein
MVRKPGQKTKTHLMEKKTQRQLKHKASFKLAICQTPFSDLVAS